MSAPHILDTLSLGKIVQIRERLFKAQAAGKKVFRFESGDPNFSIPSNVLIALQTAAAQGKTHYIPNAGIPELRKELTQKLVKKNKIPVSSSENVFVTNGAMHALFVVFQSLLNPGDEVIVPDPMWTEVVENIKLARGIPVGIPLLNCNEFQYSPQDITNKISTKTKAIFINTPHNPTGAVLSSETLLEIGKLAQKHNLWIISDEAYEDVIFSPAEHVSIASLMPEYSHRIVSIFSFSKSYAMSGLRVGYFTLHDDAIAERVQKILRCSINGVNSVAQWTALAALQGDQSPLQSMCIEYQKRGKIMFDALSGIPGVTPFYPKGSFFIWAALDSILYSKLGVKDADEVSSLLAAMGIGSAPGDAFGESCAHTLRFAFSCDTQMVEEGATLLRQALLGVK